jgi:broad specificity phosphatase PhoE
MDWINLNTLGVTIIIDMPPRFVIMCHGTSEPVSKTDSDPSIDEHGRHQCFLTAQTLSEEIKRFAAVYSSPSSVCIQSAEATSEFVTHDKLFVSDALIERHTGNADISYRMSKTDIVAKWPNIDVNFIEDELPENWTVMEPLKFVETRALLFMREVVKKHDNTDDDVLVISHHDVLFCLFMGLTFTYGDSMTLDCEELKELIHYTD